MPAPHIPGSGLIKGLGITGKTMLKTMFPGGLKKPVPDPVGGAVTVQYPHEKEAPPTRARGVIALKEENCTSCMLCARECPDWCIYIEAHKTKAPPRRAGGKPRKVNKLDRFDIDYALCMYCGICVEVCPFDALFWSPEYEFSEPHIADLLHDKALLGQWMETVPDFEPYEAGSQAKVKKVPPVNAAALASQVVSDPGGDALVAQNIAFGIIAALMIVAAIRVVTTKNVVHAALYLVIVLAGVAAQFLLLGAEFIGITQVLVYIGAIIVLFLFGIMLTRAKLGVDDTVGKERHLMAVLVALLLLGVMGYALVDGFRDVKVGERDPTFNTAAVSDSIFSQYLIPFEAVSVLLLAALIGAIVVARKD